MHALCFHLYYVILSLGKKALKILGLCITQKNHFLKIIKLLGRYSIWAKNVLFYLSSSTKVYASSPSYEYSLQLFFI